MFEYPPCTNFPTYQFNDLLTPALIPSTNIYLSKERLDWCVQSFKNYFTNIVQDEEPSPLQRRAASLLARRVLHLRRLPFRNGRRSFASCPANSTSWFQSANISPSAQALNISNHAPLRWRYTSAGHCRGTVPSGGGCTEYSVPIVEMTGGRGGPLGWVDHSLGELR